MSEKNRDKIMQRLELVAERIERAAERFERGTSHAQPSTPVLVAAPRAASLNEQIEEALRGPEAPVSIEVLAKVLATPEAKLAPMIKTLREGGKIYNLGTEDDQQWWWVVGDDAPAGEVNAAVTRLISIRPMTFKQLMSATGCRRTRVSGALVEMQKHRKDWQNLGTDKQYVWFLPPVNGGPRYRKTATEIEEDEQRPRRQSTGLHERPRTP